MEGEKAFIEFNKVRYEWLGQSTVRMTTEAGYRIYTDPVYLDENPPRADLILITHHHVDHCLPEYVSAIRDEKTKLAAYHEGYLKYCVQEIKGVRTVKIGQTIIVGDVRITGVEAYTERGFHIRGEGCGFLIEVSGSRIYFAGDTAKIAEMEGIKGVDVAILPICDNAYAINTDEIIEAVKEIRPKLFIPVHYTPPDEPEPVIQDMVFFTKDPRFFTKKEDPGRLLPAFKETGIEVAVLKKLGKTLSQK